MEKILFSSIFVLVCQFVSAQWTAVGDTVFGVSDQEVLKKVHLINDVPHVVYIDYNDDALKLVKFENNLWQEPSNNVVDTDAGNGYFETAQDALGNIYVVYINSEVQVKKWNGTTWMQVGLPNLGESNNGIPYIKVQSNNQPVITFQEYVDFNHPRNLHVKEFNGTNWVTIDANLADTTVDHSHLTIGLNDDVYVSYVTTDDSLTVEKYDGNNWSQVGEKLGNDGYYNGFLHSSSTGELLLRSRRSSGSYNWEFRKYNNVNDTWVSFPTPNTNYASLGEVVNFDSWNVEFNPVDNHWYAGFATNVDSKNYFKRFNGNSWEEVGPPVVAPLYFYFGNLTFDSQGDPFITSAYSTVVTLDLSQYTAIENDFSETNIKVYPNPSSGLFRIETEESQMIKVYDVFGKMILQTVVQPNGVVDLSTCTDGFYFVKLVGESVGMIRVIKL